MHKSLFKRNRPSKHLHSMSIMYNYPVQTPSPSSLCICSAVKSTDLDWVVPPFLQYICTIFKKTRKPFFTCRLRNTVVVTLCFSSIYFIFKQKFFLCIIVKRNLRSTLNLDHLLKKLKLKF